MSRITNGPRSTQLSCGLFETIPMNDSQKLPIRSHPDHSPHPRDAHDILFITVCTNHRRRILANDASHQTLLELWRDARYWLVGRYVLMPDHVHLFAMKAANSDVPLERWISWWKRGFSTNLNLGAETWQRDFWDTRMRSAEHYNAKWHYVMNNPVRMGLTTSSEDWLYQGEIHRLSM